MQLENILSKFLEDYKAEACYIYGSYVNGYYNKKDSDIDIVVVSNVSEPYAQINIKPNISLHVVSPSLFDFFKTGVPYAHLRMVPLKNEAMCKDISVKIKSELVRRELVRFKRKEVFEFEVLDPLYNYLLGYGLERPWRIKPIKRLLRSEESIKLLSEEYKSILEILEGRGMIESKGDKYRINENFIFDDNRDKQDIRDPLIFKIKNSYLGYHYIRNALSMLRFGLSRK